MSQASITPPQDADEVAGEIEKSLTGGSTPAVVRFFMSCLGGAIPLVGGIISGAGNVWSEKDQSHLNQLLAQWLKLQEAEIKEIGITLVEIMMRLNLQDEETLKRIESPEYLSLVRRAFRDWAAAESEQKRELIRNLLCHAAEDRLCEDDIVKLFIKWIAEYSELHFNVIKYVYLHAGSTRAEIWEELHGRPVREDAAEADLFKLLIHDLSVGHIIRQQRDTDAHGNFVKARPGANRSRPVSRIVVSAFEDGKPYVLTALGKQFVFYTMNDVVPKLT